MSERMPYENLTFMVNWIEQGKGWFSNVDPRPGGWYADFDEAGTYRNWDGIMGFLSEGGWEVASVVPTRGRQLREARTS